MLRKVVESLKNVLEDETALEKTQTNPIKE